MLVWKRKVDHQAMYDHNAFNGNNDNNGARARRLNGVRIRGMQHVGEFASSLSSACRMMGHAARTDMFRGKKEKGETSSIRHIDRKAGNNCYSSSTCLLTRKRGTHFHLLVDQKEGNCILAVAA